MISLKLRKEITEAWTGPYDSKKYGLWIRRVARWVWLFPFEEWELAESPPSVKHNRGMFPDLSAVLRDLNERVELLEKWEGLEESVCIRLRNWRPYRGVEGMRKVDSSSLSLPKGYSRNIAIKIIGASLYEREDLYQYQPFSLESTSMGGTTLYVNKLIADGKAWREKANDEEVRLTSRLAEWLVHNEFSLERELKEMKVKL